MRLPFRKARTIDEIEDRVAGADLVLTSDAPLALALNRRVDGPELGTFASTPRNYVKQGLEVADRRDLFHRVIRDTELGFKEAATRLDLALDAWEHTGDMEAILDHAAYDRPRTRAVLDVLERTESSHSLREDVTLPSGLDMAVIGLGDFSPLDRSVLGDVDDVDVVDPFAEATFELPTLDAFASIPEIVQTLEAHITPDNAGDVAIVLDPAGPVRPLVEAMLDARGIPYHAEEALAEHAELRSFLRALRKGQARERLTGREVRALLVELGLDVSIRHDARLVDRIDRPGVDRLRSFWDETEDADLSDALTAFEQLAGPMRDLREVVDELEIGDQPATAATLNALEFYLETFRVERDYTREGVLLASGRDNAYVDRPLVFYVGLGADWAQTQPTYPWIEGDEKTRLEETDLARFERLLQNGQRRVYMVQDTRQGQPVTPCFHLHELLDDEFERFADLDPQPRRAPQAGGTEAAGFDPDPPDVDPRTVTTLSASALNLLTHCPRDWYMGELVPEPDHDAIERGQSLHAFAQAYASDPAAFDVEDRDVLDELVELALADVGELVDPDDHRALATELAIGIRNVADWLDANPPRGDVHDSYTAPPPDRRDDENPFAEAFDVEIDRERTERWFDDHEVGVHGKVDLLHSPTRLVDYKSTRNPDSLGRTVRKTRVDSDETPPSLQPGVYLAHHRQAAPDRRLAFAFVDVLGNRKDVIRGDAEIDEIQRLIRYFPASFTAYARTEHAFETLRDTSQTREKLLDKLGYDAYREAMSGDLPSFDDKDTALEHPALDRLIDVGEREIGDYKYVAKGARSSCKKLVRIKEHALFAGDLDRLQNHVDDIAGDLETWLADRFPAPSEVDRDDLDNPELVVFDLDAHRRRDADA